MRINTNCINDEKNYIQPILSMSDYVLTAEREKELKRYAVTFWATKSNLKIDAQKTKTLVVSKTNRLIAHPT